MKFKIETTGKIKTPMQELIEQLKELKYSEINEQTWEVYDSVMDIAEAMREKERKTICNAFSDAQHGAVESRWTAEEYFEEIFNTKEK